MYSQWAAAPTTREEQQEEYMGLFSVRPLSPRTLAKEPIQFSDSTIAVRVRLIRQFFMEALWWINSGRRNGSIPDRRRHSWNVRFDLVAIGGDSPFPVGFYWAKRRNRQVLALVNRNRNVE